MTSSTETSFDLMRDDDLAAHVATRAGELLLALRSDLLAALPPRAAGEAADAAAEDLIAQLLAEHRPHDAVLSEEALDGAERLGASRVWIIDPLDGSREFGEDGREDWAVHVALWVSGELVAGAVALPLQHRTLSSATIPAAPASTDPAAPWRLVVSRSRPPEFLTELTAALEQSTGRGLAVRPHGSAGAKAAEVVLGRADAYLHPRSADGSGLNQWDAAAPAVVAQAAGLHVSHLDGSPLVFNGESPVTGDFLVCRPELAGPLLAALAPLLTTP
jgi:3'(2'), 5'-bisphosphate nucleotidase